MTGGVEIILMDGDFKRICAIRDFSSVLWERKYYETGSFELRLPAKYLAPAMCASYVFRKDKAECGMIGRFYKDSDGIVLSGGFLENMLKARVIDDVFKFRGTAGAAAAALVNAYCIRAGSGREIERLVIGGYGGLDDEVNVQLSGKTVYDGLRDILTEREASFHMRYDLREGVIRFYAARGLDRTDSQHENSWCVFSGDYFNIIEEGYEKSADIRNFAYVVSGAPENVSPLVVAVDAIKEGEKRIEIYVEAKDIWRGNGVSDAEVKALLTERGRQKLAEYDEGARAECVVDMRNMGNMVFELGDVCTYVNTEIGVLARARVTEITESIENNEVSVSVALGKEQMGLLGSIKRGAGN